MASVKGTMFLMSMAACFSSSALLQSQGSTWPRMGHLGGHTWVLDIETLHTPSVLPSSTKSTQQFINVTYTTTQNTNALPNGLRTDIWLAPSTVLCQKPSIWIYATSNHPAQIHCEVDNHKCLNWDGTKATSYARCVNDTFHESAYFNQNKVRNNPLGCFLWTRWCKSEDSSSWLAILLFGFVEHLSLPEFMPVFACVSSTLTLSWT